MNLRSLNFTHHPPSQSECVYKRVPLCVLIARMCLCSVCMCVCNNLLVQTFWCLGTFTPVPQCWESLKGRLSDPNNECSVRDQQREKQRESISFTVTSFALCTVLQARRHICQMKCRLFAYSMTVSENLQFTQAVNCDTAPAHMDTVHVAPEQV